jgi:hypothetical protein
MISNKESLLFVLCTLFIVSITSIWISIYFTSFEFLFFIGMLSLLMTIIYLLKYVSSSATNYSPIINNNDFITAIDDNVFNKV